MNSGSKDSKSSVLGGRGALPFAHLKAHGVGVALTTKCGMRGAGQDRVSYPDRGEAGLWDSLGCPIR